VKVLLVLDGKCIKRMRVNAALAVAAFVDQAPSCEL
jgi:hypothetical protein